MGCAGSDHTFAPAPARAPAVGASDVTLRIAVSGAKGGHSGEDIATGRVNAIKALGRVLSAAYEASAFGLVAFAAG